MLYSPTKNTKYIYIYTLLIEIFIGFTAFALFFGVFANYFYDDYLKNRLIDNLNKSLSFYQLNNTPPGIAAKTNLEIFQALDKDNTRNSGLEYNENTKNRNIERNYFIYLILGITGLLLLFIIIPLIIGIIPTSLIDFKFIGINYLIHIIFVISFELILVLGIFSFVKCLSIADSMNTISSDWGHIL